MHGIGFGCVPYIGVALRAASRRRQLHGGGLCQPAGDRVRAGIWHQHRLGRGFGLTNSQRRAVAHGIGATHGHRTAVAVALGFRLGDGLLDGDGHCLRRGVKVAGSVRERRPLAH